MLIVTIELAFEFHTTSPNRTVFFKNFNVGVTFISENSSLGPFSLLPFQSKFIIFYHILIAVLVNDKYRVTAVW